MTVIEMTSACEAGAKHLLEHPYAQMAGLLSNSMFEARVLGRSSSTAVRVSYSRTVDFVPAIFVPWPSAFVPCKSVQLQNQASGCWEGGLKLSLPQSAYDVQACNRSLAAVS